MTFFSEFQLSYLLLPLIGFAVGILASMLGSGGGFFFPIILMLFYQVPAQIAVATSLAASVPLCMAGTLEHYRKKHIHRRLSLGFGIAGVTGAIAGVWLTRQLESGQIKTIFGVYSIILAFIIFFNGNGQKDANGNQPDIKTHFSLLKTAGASLFGFAGGLISGTLGVSGSAAILAGLFTLKLPVKLVVGTSLAVVLVNTISAMIGHFIIGKIDLTLVIFLTAGTMAGAFTGAHFLANIDTDRWESPVKKIFAVIVVISGILMITNTGINF